MDPSQNVAELSDDTYDDFIRKNQVAVVDFWGPSCAPCKMIAPVLEQLASEMKGRVAFGKLDVTKNLGTVERMGREHGSPIRSIPTLAFYRAGRLVKTKVGFVPKTGLITEITDLSR